MNGVLGEFLDVLWKLKVAILIFFAGAIDYQDYE